MKKLNSILQSVRQSVNYQNYIILSDRKYYIRDKDRNLYDWLFDAYKPYKRREDAKYRLYLESFSNIAYRRVCKDLEYKSAQFKADFQKQMANYQLPENVSYKIDIDYLFPMVESDRQIDFTINVGEKFDEKLPTNVTAEQLANLVKSRLNKVGKLLNTDGFYFRLWRYKMENQFCNTRWDKRRIIELHEVKPLISNFRKSLMAQIDSDRTKEDRIKMRLLKKHGITVNEDFAEASEAELCEILKNANGYNKKTIIFKNARYYADEMRNFMEDFDGDFEEAEAFIYSL